MIYSMKSPWLWPWNTTIFSYFFMAKYSLEGSGWSQKLGSVVMYKSWHGNDIEQVYRKIDYVTKSFEMIYYLNLYVTYFISFIIFLYIRCRISTHNTGTIFHVLYSPDQSLDPRRSEGRFTAVPLRHGYPLVNTHSYGKSQFIMDLPIEDGDFPVRYVCLPEGIDLVRYHLG